MQQDFLAAVANVSTNLWGEGDSRMRTLVMMRSPAFARQLALELENLGEEWQVHWTSEALVGQQYLRSGTVELLLLDGEMAQQPGDAGLAALALHPPLPPPWVLCLGKTDEPVDGTLPPEGNAETWASMAKTLDRKAGLPCLCGSLLPPLTELARTLLTELGLREELRAAAFLPEMIAWCAVHPPLLKAVTGRLYPCFAKRYGLRPGAVERDVRSALESLWSRGSLPAIEKWFGHTVDPEKGRPTNREFLALTAEHIRHLGKKKLLL